MRSVTPNTGKFRWGNGNPYSSCLRAWAQHKVSYSTLSLVHMALGPGVPTKLLILVHTAPPCLQPALRQQLACRAASHAISLGRFSTDTADIPEVWFWHKSRELKQCYKAHFICRGLCRRLLVFSAIAASKERYPPAVLHPAFSGRAEQSQQCDLSKATQNEHWARDRIHVSLLLSSRGVWGFFFKNMTFLPVGCRAPWHQPQQTVPASPLYKNELGTISKWSKGCPLGHGERGFQSKQSRENVMQNRFSIPFLPTLPPCVVLTEDVSPGCGLAAQIPSSWASAAPRGWSAALQRDSGFCKLALFHMGMKLSLSYSLP